jgi:hypothetical protein
MWARTPDKLGLKPPIVSESNTLGSKFILWGEPARMLRRDGQLGLNSQLTIGTAKEVEAGRGLTIHSLHLSEVAFYRDIRKLLAILNAVPDHPDTLVLKESTADGLNHFKDDWDAAEAGESAYLPIFAAWHEDARRTGCRSPTSRSARRSRRASGRARGARRSPGSWRVRLRARAAQLAALHDRQQVRQRPREVPSGAPVHAAAGVPDDGQAGVLDHVPQPRAEGHRR